MKVEDLRPRMDDPAARKRRQAALHAVPPRARRNAARLHRRSRHCRGPRGFLFRTSRGHTATALSDRPMVQSQSATTASGQPGSSPISPMAARLSMHNRWPRMRAHARPSFTIARRIGSRRTRWRGYAYDRQLFGNFSEAKIGIVLLPRR
jgi:hypothetical protein